MIWTALHRESSPWEKMLRDALIGTLREPDYIARHPPRGRKIQSLCAGKLSVSRLRSGKRFSTNSSHQKTRLRKNCTRPLLTLPHVLQESLLIRKSSSGDWVSYFLVLGTQSDSLSFSIILKTTYNNFLFIIIMLLLTTISLL
jgi:hypothetical protein